MEQINYQTISRLVKQATKYDLKAYCELRGLSLSSLYNGYISKKAKKILIKDGVINYE